MHLNIRFALLLMSIPTALCAEITVAIDADSGRIPISPWIYGKNNSLSDKPDKPMTTAELHRLREAGVRMLRENGGNNATKYNWRKKLSSHPDWYNNVYPHDWDYQARTLQDSLPGTQGFLALQLLGVVAANNEHNFNDWDYNSSDWWSGCTQNLAGGGTINPEGGDSALVDGDPSLYLEPWPAESATGILDHWFGSEGIGLDKSRFLYWNMDNEPEIWQGTHSDAVASPISAEEFMQRYFAVAKSARKRFPDIKLAGFVACNEWQWYAWNNTQISVTEGGSEKKYVWSEYFIKRIAEEQKATGVRLLDVMDFHFYPKTESDPALTAQLHRVWFDTAWNYPKANGCKLIGGGWDNNSTREFIMERCSRWLGQYMGAGHAVRFGVSEYGTIYADDQNVVAVWHASQLGTFADHGVELFTPWEWSAAMWEVLHLYSRYSGSIRVAAASDLDTVVSAYASIGSSGASMTVFLVNRDATAAQPITLQLNGFNPSAEACTTLTLHDLPADSETFVSHDNNALVKGTIPISGTTVTTTLPAMSVTALLIPGAATMHSRRAVPHVPHGAPAVHLRGRTLYLQSLPEHKDHYVRLYRINGTVVKTLTSGGSPLLPLSLTNLPQGEYIVDIDNGMLRKAFVLMN